MKKNVILEESDIFSLGSNEKSLQQKVYDTLVAKFMNRELVPGQVINRRQLAAEMNVSVSPVLEALVKLEQEGFVVSIPRRGTIVRSVKAEEYFGHLLLREALEVEAVAFYCGEKIRSNYDELIAFARKMDETDIVSLEHARMEVVFHCSLVNLAGISPLFQEFVRVNRTSLFYKINSFITTKKANNQRHVDLIDNLCTNDIVKAAEAIRLHVRSGKPGIDGFLKGYNGAI